MARRILIIDDEQGIRAALGQLLEFEGYEVKAVANAVDGISEYQRFTPHLVFLDVKMAGIDGVEALKRIKDLDSDAIVVMISGHATIQTAVEATQLGAYDILEKPLDTDRILVTLRNALQHLDLHEENARLKETIQSRYEIVGRSYAIRAVIDKIDRVAKAPSRVLITGENGTGKELVARALHSQSTRASGPFVEVNCAAIPSELIESELFGHMKGSFTGAVIDRAGKFEQANGGTIFLDEIGDMSLAAQAKVLRVLEDGVVTRIGGSKPIEVDVRVLAATNKNVESEIVEGRFREDLYYRLNVVPIHIPPLRERREDIPLLVGHFLAVLTSREGIAPRSIAPDAGPPGPSRMAGQCARAAQHDRTAADPVGRSPDHGGRHRAPRRPARYGTGRAWLAARVQDLRGVQAGGRAGVPAREAAAVRLERVRDRPCPRHAAVESVQEDRAILVDERGSGVRSGCGFRVLGFGGSAWRPRFFRKFSRLETQLKSPIPQHPIPIPNTQHPSVPERDWSKELAKVDKQLASMSDEELRGPPPAAAASKPPGVRATAAPSAPPIGTSRPATTTFGVYARLTLSVVLGVAMMVWPYQSRCGVGLAGYLAAVAVVIASGVWSAVWTWRHRAARAHALSLLIVLWGMVLGSLEVLPRVGYAKPDLRHLSTWACR
jgi:two-component system, NtrC family, nitrogen regulation response regulator NtrX